MKALNSFLLILFMMIGLVSNGCADEKQKLDSSNNKYAGTATGSFSADGQNYAMKYAYAEPFLDEGVIVLLTDQSLTEDQVIFFPIDQVKQGKLHGMSMIIDKPTQQVTNLKFYDPSSVKEGDI